MCSVTIPAARRFGIQSGFAGLTETTFDFRRMVNLLLAEEPGSVKVFASLRLGYASDSLQPFYRTQSS